MTNTGRLAIAILGLLAGVLLILTGEASELGSGMITLVLGYAFGDRNGEKRLAAELTHLAAAERRDLDGG